MASLTPSAPGTGGPAVDAEMGALRLLITPTAESARVARRVRSRVVVRAGQAVRRGRRLLPVADAALGTVVAAVVLGASGTGGLTAGPADAVLVAVVWCVALASAGAWSVTKARALGRAVRSVLGAGVFVGLACWVAQGLLAPEASSRQSLVLTGSLVAISLAPRLLLAGTAGPTRVVIAGASTDVVRVASELARAGSRWQVVSHCHLDDPSAPVGSEPDCALTRTPVAAARAAHADAILAMPGPALDPITLRQLSWAAHAAGLDLLVGTALLDVASRRVRPLAVGELNLAEVQGRIGPCPSRLVKEACERVLALLALALLLPLLVTIAVAVRLDSPGGALFSQRRVGRNGETFMMHKFRTMRAGAEQLRADLTDANECDGVLFKVREDPRITRTGAVLRRYSLDELPQLVNVLRGEMSLVGPRPALPEEVARYDTDPRHRLVVKPGLTGLWQVSGRSDLSWEESVRLDLHYVDNWSLALDAHILTRTVRAVIGHRGAY